MSDRAKKFYDSWNCLQQALKVFQNTTLKDGKNFCIAHIFNFKGECLIGKQQYAEALIYLHKTREIYQTQINWEKDHYHVAASLYDMGTSLVQSREYEDVLNWLKQSLKIYKTFPLNKHIANKIE